MGSRVTSAYDESGKVTEWSYDSMGAGRVYVKYEYDAEGNLVEQRFYAPDETGMSTDPDGSFRIDKYERDYDEAGNLISYVKTQCYAGQDCITVQKNEYQYDEEGHLVEAVIFEPVTEQSTSFKYEYDSEGKQTGYTYYNADGNLTGYGVVECDTASTGETTEPTGETAESTGGTTEPTEETTEPTEEAA